MSSSASRVIIGEAMTIGFLYELNVALGVACLGFLFYLLLPKAIQKYYFRAHRKRFTRSSHLCHDVPLHISTKRSAYVSLKDQVINSPSVYSPNLLIDTGGAFDTPAPLILDPGQACIVTAAYPGVEACRSFESAPMKLFSPPSGTKLRAKSTPVAPRIANEISQNKASPDSVLDRSLDPSKKLVVLMSSRCLNRQQDADQKEALVLLRQRKIPHETVDSTDPMNRRRREELYLISGIRAKMPQFFFQHADGTATTYLGDFKMLQKIHHAEGLPKMYRDANPNLSTWDQVFADTSQIFCV